MTRCHPVASKTARLAIVAAFALGLAACSSDSKKDEVEPNIFPANYKQEIIDTLTNSLPDPTNVREAYITEPTLAPGSRDQRYTVCVRYNARDASRRYMGSTDRVAFFFGGRLNQLIEADKERCAKAAYKPFPELEKLCLAKTCD